MDTDNNGTAAPGTELLETSLGELIAAFYEEFLAVYGDPELASLAAATVINDMLADSGEEQPAARVA